MEYNYNDGGRSRYFKAKVVRDCVTRSIAIASRRDYKEVYDLIRKRTGDNPREGVHTNRKAFKELMAELGFTWVATMGIGTGCQVHLREGELPGGRLVCSCSGHYTAIIDGVVNDTFNPTRDGDRCVYGYWIYNEPQAPEETTASVEFSALNEEHAKRLVELLNGRTYYNLRASWYSYPCKGNERVEVATTREGATQLELLEMVATLLAEEIK